MIERHAELSFLSREVALHLAEPHPGCSSDHTAQFYDNDDRLIESVVGFISDGLHADDGILVILTDEHRSMLQARCTAEGLDVRPAVEKGQLLFSDAPTFLTRIVHGSTIDEQRLFALMDRDVNRLQQAGVTGALRAFGEGVNLLCREGNAAAAIRLEEVWNVQLKRKPMRTVCAYSLSSFDREPETRDFLEICRQHSQIWPARSSLQPMGDSWTRELCLLQQRVHALAHECDLAQAARSEFLGVMSHELRTPLNGIIGYQDLLIQEVAGPLTSRQREYLERIRAGAAQLHGLIDQVLTLSHLQSGQIALHKQNIDARELVLRTVTRTAPLAARKDLRIEVRTAEPGLQLFSDPGKLEQILMNLLSNAVKFTEKGTIEVVVRDGAGQVWFEVRDTGPGINPVDLPHIFEPFKQANSRTTRNHGGMGLGLTVSRSLAHALGGDLSVTSTSGAGTVLTLRLPQTAPPPDAQHARD